MMSFFNICGRFAVLIISTLIFLSLISLNNGQLINQAAASINENQVYRLFYQNNTNDNVQWDIYNAMIAIYNRIMFRTTTTVGLQTQCDIVLIYDDLLRIPLNLVQIWNENKASTTIPPPLFFTLNLSKHSNLPLNHNPHSNQHLNISSSIEFDCKSKRLASYLHSLYRINNCYIFMVWVHDPRILYPSNFKLHPGWRSQDYVIATFHEMNTINLKQQEQEQHQRQKYTEELIKYRLWKEIPKIIGLKYRKTIKSTYITLFTVDPYYFRFNSNSSFVNLSQESNNGARSKEIDVWSVKDKSFQKNSNTLFPNKFKSLNGNILRLGILWKEPYFIFGDLENPYFDGLDWRLLSLIAEKLNFKHSWHMTQGSGSKIDLGENSSWTGVMGEIEQGKVDFGMGGISISPKRLEDFSFCRAYWSDAYTFISPTNKSDLNRLQSLVQPLSVEVWIGIGISYVITTISLKIFAEIQLDQLAIDSNTNKHKDKWFRSCSNNLYVLWSIFLQKSFRHVPKTNSVRCIYISMSFGLFILGITFGGGLYAKLLEPKKDISIDHPKQFRGSGLPLYGRNYDGHFNDYVEHSNSKGLKRGWQERTTYILINQTIPIMNEVVFGRGLYIDSRSRLTYLGNYNYAGINGLKFHMPSYDFLRVNNGWPIRKNWPLKQEFDEILIRVVESGIVNHWMNHFMRGKIGLGNEAVKITMNSMLKPKDNTTKNIDPSIWNRNYDKLKIEHVKGIMLIWVIGLLIATAIFMLEIGVCCTFTTKQVLQMFFKAVLKSVKNAFISNKRLYKQKSQLTKKLKAFNKKQRKIEKAKAKKGINETSLRVRKILVISSAKGDNEESKVGLDFIW